MIMTQLLLSYIVPLALLVFVGWALFECLRRNSEQYTLARLSKNWWIGILLLALLVQGNRFVWWVPLPSSWLLSLAALFAAVYFLGPECQRMGPRGRRQSRGQRGGW